MPFQLSDVKETFEWPVKVRIPQKGSWREQRFLGSFHLLDQDRIDEIVAKYQGLEPESEGEEEKEASENLAAEIFAGWNEEVRDHDGNPLPVTEDNRRILLKISYVRTAVVRAYFEAVGGRKAKLGN